MNGPDMSIDTSLFTFSQNIKFSSFFCGNRFIESLYLLDHLRMVCGDKCCHVGKMTRKSLIHSLTCCCISGVLNEKSVLERFQVLTTFHPYPRKCRLATTRTISSFSVGRLCSESSYLCPQ